MTTTTNRLTGQAAVRAWPERLAVALRDPSDENMQRLCTLLDAIDRWVCQRWDERGHDERRVVLAKARSEAAEARRRASEALRVQREQKGVRGAAAKSRAGAGGD